MAFATLTIEDKKDKLVKEAPVGFSWTVLFFGGFVPLVRGDWGYFFIMLVANYFRLKNITVLDKEKSKELKLNIAIFYLASYGYIFLVLMVTHYFNFQKNL